MNELNSIGFMQGRLSPLINGCIQAFPWGHWQSEFLIAQKINIHLMEWTLDQERLYENPLMTEIGQAEILSLSRHYGVGIFSLTGDCFMQAPLWKAQGEKRSELEQDFIAILRSCVAVGINLIVIPLVDNGGLENIIQENSLVTFLESQTSFLNSNGLKILFESDYTPQELMRFISRLDPSLFGINYDIGNSAALGFDPQQEIAIYGSRILNVHVKDRLLGGGTVALGAGNANFNEVFAALAKINYQGNFILQTARALDGNHSNILGTYRDLTMNWLKKYAA